MGNINSYLKLLYFQLRGVDRKNIGRKKEKKSEKCYQQKDGFILRLYTWKTYIIANILLLRRKEIFQTMHHCTTHPLIAGDIQSLRINEKKEAKLQAYVVRYVLATPLPEHMQPTNIIHTFPLRKFVKTVHIFISRLLSIYLRNIHKYSLAIIISGIIFYELEKSTSKLNFFLIFFSLSPSAMKIGVEGLS